MEIARATVKDIDYICHLQKIEANREDSIGFVPRDGYLKEIDGRRNGLILIGRENNDEIGFVYATQNNAGITRIQQIAVQDDARRSEIGTVLVNSVARPNDWLITLRCRENLPAVSFWENLDFEIYGIDHTPTKRKKGVLNFQKVIGGIWAHNKMGQIVKL